jgi:ADP-heptose:LPS heptosyltransferase
LHEAELNLKLLSPIGVVPPPLSELPAYFLIEESLPPLRYELLSLLDPHRFRLVLHPFSRGHGKEWPPSYFQKLISLLPRDRYQIILTGSAEERKRWDHTVGNLTPGILNLMGETNLADLIGLLARVDGVLASGTGPLHLSAFLGKRTLGLFPPIPGIGPERWRPIGPKAEYLTAPFRCKNCSDPSRCECMAKISPEMVAERILRWGDPDPRGD